MSPTNIWYLFTISSGGHKSPQSDAPKVVLRDWSWIARRQEGIEQHLWKTLRSPRNYNVYPAILGVACRTNDVRCDDISSLISFLKFEDWVQAVFQASLRHGGSATLILEKRVMWSEANVACEFRIRQSANGSWQRTCTRLWEPKWYLSVPLIDLIITKWCVSKNLTGNHLSDVLWDFLVSLLCLRV